MIRRPGRLRSLAGTGENMPKMKRRGKGNRADKEKPLLTVQGVLRLEKSFITAQHDDAQTIMVRRSDDAPVEEIKLIPGRSEHEMVEYKAGYDVGPSNPHPETEPEAKILEEQKKVEASEEAFEEMKRRSEAERKERETIFKKREEEKRRRLGLLPMAPPGTEEVADDKDLAPKVAPKSFNPDDPSDYQLPEHLKNDPAFFNDQPLEFGPRPAPPSAQCSKAPSLEDGEEVVDLMNIQIEDPIEKTAGDSGSRPEIPDNDEGNQGHETQEFPEDMLPKMKPLPLPSEAKDVSKMALDVATEMEEKRKKEARDRIINGKGEDMDDDIIFSLDELTRMQEAETNTPKIGPELTQQSIEEVVRQQREEKAEAQDDKRARELLQRYWQFVRENPRDFNGWCYLVQHAETLEGSPGGLDEVREAYNAFLSLFPYCFAYWQRYSQAEIKHENWQRALEVLHRGVQAFPLSLDLWLDYLSLYKKLYSSRSDFADLFRTQCEDAIQKVGLDYRSDTLWERYLEWEADHGDLRWVTGIYKRLVSIPTRLYNRHWDSFIAHVRDHHPRDILDYEEYEELRRVTCRELDLTYRPDPAIEPVQAREVVLPEDKMKAGMKERIVASVVAEHERTEQKVDAICKFEEKIKRAYFHVKPLDLRQLKNWEAYLEHEIAEGNHERIVILFERCLVACAQYEKFWEKYARYLEQYHKTKSKVTTQGASGSLGSTKPSPLKRAKWAFGTGLGRVEEMRENRCTWTMRGWKGTDKEGNEIMMAEEISAKHQEEEKRDGHCQTRSKDDEKSSAGSDDNCLVEVAIGKDNEKEAVAAADEPGSSLVDKGDDSIEKAEQTKDCEKAQEKSHLAEEASVKIGPEYKTDFTKDTEKNEPDGGPKYMENDESEESWQESVRYIYTRACLVHCPTKALIRLRWSAFEEECGRIEDAKKKLIELRKEFPLLLECRMQLIDLERRRGNLKEAEKLYEVLLKEIPRNRRSVRTWVSLKLARYQFRVRGEPDKALETLRKASKRGERGDVRLYAQIVDILTQLRPLDVKRVAKAFELALSTQGLSNMQRLAFAKRQVEFMQEFGSIKELRDARDQIRSLRLVCAVDIKAEAKRKKELEREEKRMKELEALKAQVRAEVNMKAKLAESEGRLMCTNCQTAMYPDAEGVYEFERFRPGMRPAGNSSQKVADETAGAADDDGVVDLMDWAIPEDQEEQIRKTLEEKTRYKEVAPTWELNMETYGYGRKRKTYDPDYEHVESAKFREYERLETKGYDEELKDHDSDKPRNISAPGLGLGTEGEGNQKKLQYTSSDYIIPPKVPQLQLGPGLETMKENQGRVPGKTLSDQTSVKLMTFIRTYRNVMPMCYVVGSEEAISVFQLPPEIADPQSSPCVNVPEWFVKEGGELCLSDTAANGMSMLRYWPKFLSEKGNHLMFHKLRRYCKWHQKQVRIGGAWKYETRLVAWYGPCNYDYSGLHLEKNLNWAPELLDLLHRLVALTRHEFNSCFLNLYRHGHDMCGWHADTHPQLGRNPAIASVSLGAIRVFELRKKNGPPNFIRFPLFPGSLLVMEGATQEDWLHCLPRDVNCTEERINLTFRTMYSIDKR